MNWQRQLTSYSRRAFTFVKHNQFRTLLLLVGVVIIAFVGRDLFVVFVSGYEWKSGTGFAGKTLWEWMELLVIPAVLAVGAILFNRAERRTEIQIAEEGRKTDRDIASRRSQDAALQAYLDKMTELLLDRGLRKSDKDSEVRAVARARTLTTLRTLDGTRKGSLLRFLCESELITKNYTIVGLTGADLSEAKLFGVDLTRIELSNTNLRRADLTGADLGKANLEGADLRRANLTGAYLEGAYLNEADLRCANLHEADLTETDLTGAYLDGANLSRANLTNADLIEADLTGADLSWTNLNGTYVTERQLSEAKTLKGAIMPGGTEHE